MGGPDGDEMVACAQHYFLSIYQTPIVFSLVFCIFTARNAVIAGSRMWLHSNRNVWRHRIVPPIFTFKVTLIIQIGSYITKYQAMIDNI